MLEGAHIGLKVDVDTLRGTREGVPRLAQLLKKHGVDATFYFSVGPDHTGRALRRVFRKGFAQKVARTSVLKHYGLKTLMYGVLLPGPDIGREAGDIMRSVHDAGFEVGLHTYDHVRWQDGVAASRCGLDPHGIRARPRGVRAGVRIPAGTRMRRPAGRSTRTRSSSSASTACAMPATRAAARAFLPLLAGGASSCPQIPTTLPTFDELLGRDSHRGVEHRRGAVRAVRGGGAPGAAGIHTARRARGDAAARRVRVLAGEVARCRRAWSRAWPPFTHSRCAGRCRVRAVVRGEVPGRSGLLAQ